MGTRDLVSISKSLQHNCFKISVFWWRELLTACQWNVNTRSGYREQHAVKAVETHLLITTKEIHNSHQPANLQQQYCGNSLNWLPVSRDWNIWESVGKGTSCHQTKMLWDVDMCWVAASWQGSTAQLHDCSAGYSYSSITMLHSRTILKRPISISNSEISSSWKELFGR